MVAAAGGEDVGVIEGAAVVAEPGALSFRTNAE